MFYKPEVRNKLRQRRADLDKASAKKASEQVAAQVIHLDCFIESKKIACYLSQENELDTMPIIHCALQANKEIYLPVVGARDDKELRFFEYQANETLKTNRYAIQEPDTSSRREINKTEIDLIFVPLVGFDPHGNRLGRGCGYYDYTFAFKLEKKTKKPILIGLAYEFQKISAIEPNKWDVPLDCVITELGSYP